MPEIATPIGTNGRLQMLKRVLGRGCKRNSKRKKQSVFQRRLAVYYLAFWGLKIIVFRPIFTHLHTHHRMHNQVHFSIHHIFAVSPFRDSRRMYLLCKIWCRCGVRAL
jgi:hypothetical protein